MSGQNAPKGTLSPVAPPLPALTKHLLFIVVDGLRYDYANDPKWAPNFARHMKDNPHAEIVAGRITMTSAAVFSFGTGRRGTFAHVALNLHTENTGFNHIIDNMRKKGLRTGLVGDKTWSQVYGKFDPEFIDDHDVSVDTDNTDELLIETEKMIYANPRPEFMVSHILTPDHAGHAFGTISDRYKKFLASFDERFEAFLKKIPPEITVVVLSDHGATDTGTHGTDIPSVRRTPLFAFGPGIAEAKEGLKYEQVDIAPTLATLLGIAGPTHGRGTIAVDLLAITDEQRANSRCTDVSRLPALAEAEGWSDLSALLKTKLSTCAQGDSADARERSSSALAAARLYDERSDQGTDEQFRRQLWLMTGLLTLFLLAVFPIVSTAAQDTGNLSKLTWFVLGHLALAIAIMILTREVEKVTPPWHNVIRAILFIVGNLGFFLGMIKPHLGRRFFAGSPLMAWLFLPCTVAWSYPANTQPESLVLALSISILFLLLARERAKDDPLLPRALVMLVVGALVIFPFGIIQDAPLSPHTAEKIFVRLGGPVLALAWLGAGHWVRQPKGPNNDVIVAMVIALFSMGLKELFPFAKLLGSFGMTLGPIIGMTGLIGAAIAGGVFLAKDRLTLGLAFLFASYALDSRPMDLPAVIAGVLVAEAAGTLLALALKHEQNKTLWAVALGSSVLFGITYVVRMGLQGGLDFALMDFTAGVWGDAEPSQIRIGAAIALKYAIATAMVAVVFLRAIPKNLVLPILTFLAFAYVARAGVHGMAALHCTVSFWSSLRLMSDLPATVVMALVMVTLFALNFWRTARNANPTSQSSTV